MAYTRSLFLDDSDLAWARTRPASDFATASTTAPEPAAAPAPPVSIQTLPLREQVYLLQKSVGKLSPRDADFARSLATSFHRYGNLTPGQRPYVIQLLERATGTTPTSAPAKPTIQLGSFAAVIALFRTAAEHLRYPKVRLMLDNGTPVILSVAGAASKAPGTVNVTGEGQYPDRAWYGRVSPAGQWEPARSVSPETLAAIAALLTAFGLDPNGTAAAYGRATNHCCFCSRELTDRRSVAAGYGPICAEHYGLTAQWEAAADAESLQGTLGGVIA